MYKELLVDYPPIFPSWLYLTRNLILNSYETSDHLFQLVMKSFPLLTNIAATCFIYKKISSSAALKWSISFPLFIVIALWGQTDAAFGILMILFFYYMSKDKDLAVTLVFTIMCLFKHQGIYFVFPLLIYLFTKKSVRIALKDLVCGASVGYICWLPFVISNQNILFPLKVYLNALGKYPRYSYNAPNIWYVLNNVYIRGVLSNMYAYLGLILCIYLLFRFYRKTKDITVSTYLYLFSLFMITLKQHERYILYSYIMLFILTVVFERSEFKEEYKLLTLSASIHLFSFMLFRNYLNWIPHVSFILNTIGFIPMIINIYAYYKAIKHII